MQEIYIRSGRSAICRLARLKQAKDASKAARDYSRMIAVDKAYGRLLQADRARVRRLARRAP